MNINRSSWHFKLLDKLDFKISRRLKYEDEVVTLCQYFWNVVAGVIIGATIGFIIAFLVLGSLFILSSILTGLVVFFGASWLPVLEYDSFMFGQHSVGLALSFFLSVAFIWQTAIDQVKEGKIVPQWLKPSKQEITPKQETKPNILFEYVKAKKNKFCPVVKLED